MWMEDSVNNSFSTVKQLASGLGYSSLLSPAEDKKLPSDSTAAHSSEQQNPQEAFFGNSLSRALRSCNRDLNLLALSIAKVTHL